MLCHHITWHFIVHTETNSVSGCDTFQNGVFFYEVAYNGTSRCVFHSSFFVCRSDPVLPYRIFLFFCPQSTVFLKVFLVSQLLAFVVSSMFFFYSLIQFLATRNKFLPLLLVHWIQGFFLSLSLFPNPQSESVFNKAQFRRNSGTFSDHFMVFLTSE